MPQKNSHTKGSVSKVFRPARPPSEATKTRAAAPVYAAVPERCIDLWLAIIARSIAIQREYNQRYAGPLFDEGISDTAYAARFRSRMTMQKNLNTLLGSAQTGLQSALGMKVHFGAHSRTSRWEAEKMELPPWMRYAAETSTSQMLERYPVDIPEDHEQCLNQVSPSDELLSRANEITDAALQSWIEQVASIGTVLAEIEKRFAGTVFKEGLSERANRADFRRCLTMMKRVIGTLLSVQQGLQSALAAQMHCEWKSATQDRKAARVEEEALQREWSEKIWLMACERALIYGTSMLPEVNRLRSTYLSKVSTV